ncbi:MAG: hypothetical protein VR72_06595 [Clostridiaceae bacterium BRH_c20a]|nr:MAG: hypothetical protein VR72_06595 [Clostridiaceae bacterium BRH_c20a]
MKKNVFLALLFLIIIGLIIGCTSPKEEPKTPEQIAEEEYQDFENHAIKIAKEFVVATQGDKEKIKELSFPALLKDIEEKNWSIMLVEEIKIKPETFEAATEKLGQKQVLIRLFYEGDMNMEGEIISVKLSSKLGVIEIDGKPVIFSVE